MGHRIAIISNVMPLVEPLAERLRELGHEPVAWLLARSAGDGRPPPPWGEASDSTGPQGLSILLAEDKDAVAPLLSGLDLDVTLCWGFSWKLPQEALDIPRLGSVNQHPGRLPRHRGPYPMAWALRDGDDVFGVTWHRMDADYDTGPILAETTVPIDDQDTSIEQIGMKMLPAVLGLLPRVFERLDAGDRGDSAVRGRSRLGRRLRRGLRVHRLGAAGGDHPRPGSSLVPHVREREGAGADRGARRRAHEAPPHEPDRPRRRRPRRGVRRRAPVDRRVRVCRYLTRKLPIMSRECGSHT